MGNERLSLMQRSRRPHLDGDLQQCHQCLVLLFQHSPFLHCTFLIARVVKGLGFPCQGMQANVPCQQLLVEGRIAPVQESPLPLQPESQVTLPFRFRFGD